MVLIFGSSDEPNGYRQSLIFVALLLPVLAGTTYLLLYYLVPRYLLKERFSRFILYSSYAIIAAAWMEMMIVMGMFVLLYQFQIDQLNPRITDLGYLTGVMFLVILPAAATQITRQWYSEKSANDRLKQKNLELELHAREVELDYLKEQIRPHFLFNVLNNLYGLTLEKSDQAPELVLTVSSMLDYMIYRSSGERVSLMDELKHISSYIDIHKIRYGDRLIVNMNTEPDIQHCLIPPMVLLPFVENCIKHGASRMSGTCTIEIRLSVQNSRLCFIVVNSISPDLSDGEAGVGLKNVLKRLDLLYGDQYTFNSSGNDREHRVELSIPVSRETREEA